MSEWTPASRPCCRAPSSSPPADVPALDELPDADRHEALERVASIKLNGGLATTMGLRQPEVAGRGQASGRTFLDIIVGQTLALRRRYGIRLPLLLMNSEATGPRRWRRWPAIRSSTSGLPLTSCRAWSPSSRPSTLGPVRWPPAPALEWCPPGHGDVYGALRRSGILEGLLDAGFRYAMISNADNLGARARAADRRVLSRPSGSRS